jgi:Cyclin-dependent kinase inhibitor 3 (CDKN3)
MRPQVYWINLPMAGRLAIMGRPRAGDWLDDEISGWRAQGIDIVISLLEQEEVSELGLQREAGLCRDQGMEFLSFPIPDRGVPQSLRDAVALARAVSTKIGEGSAIAVHCRAGIGRSSLIAACALVCSGSDPAAAFEVIGKARGVSIPDTEGQRDWVTAFRDLVTAAKC